MTLAIKNLKIHRPDGRFEEGTLYVRDGRIVAPTAADVEIDGEGQYACPGMIDMHTHGRCGGDFCAADVALLRTMANDYARRGVTAVLFTLASDTEENWHAALSRAASCGEKSYIGIHFEGCWLAGSRRGAHAPELLRAPSVDELERLITVSSLPILKISAAPELDEDGSFLAACVRNGIHFSIGHTDADHATAKRALDGGADCFTHLFNAMPPLHHRSGGPIAAALTDPRAFVEMICDGIHIAPETVRLAYRTKGADRFILISDSMAGTGCPDGTYEIAGQPAVVKDGMALTPDGKLAGSTLDLLRGVQNLAAFCEIPFGVALLSATRTPAFYLGMAGERGSLEEGARADIFFLNSIDDAMPARVMKDGEWIS
ncbi:MAG: N-acetylglucosamine-6-phosphate deacetylase [Ruminococcaceae bacterium]|nr:N-acetylglucosamine-6-phosphate deacetylase [Oscillospiraceae bacterium]